MRLEEKIQITNELREKFLNAKMMVVTEYKGLGVGKLNELRRKLRDSGSEYQVVKNSLLNRASEDTPYGIVKDNFNGPTAIVLSFIDPVSSAKVLIQFASDNEKLRIRVAVLNGRVLDAGAIKSLSLLPSRHVLLGQLLGTLNSIPTNMVRTLAAVPGNLLNALQAIKEQKGKASA